MFQVRSSGRGNGAFLPAFVLCAAVLGAGNLNAQDVELKLLLPPLAQKDGENRALFVTDANEVVVDQRNASGTTQSWWRYAPDQTGTLIVERAQPFSVAGAANPVSVVGFIVGGSAGLLFGIDPSNETKNAHVLFDSDGPRLVDIGEAVREKYNNELLSTSVGANALSWGGETVVSVEFTLRGAEAQDPWRYGIATWTKSHGSQVIAVSGEETPGIEAQYFDGTNGSGLRSIGVSETGLTLVQSMFTGTVAQREGWWMGHSTEDLTFLARRQPSPSSADLSPYDAARSGLIHLFRDGQVLIVGAALDYDNRILKGAPDKLDTVFRDGDPVPGFEEGIHFQGVDANLFAEPGVFLLTGLLHAEWDTLSTLPGQGAGWWFVDADRKPHLIAWTTKPLDGAPDYRCLGRFPKINRNGHAIHGNIDRLHRFTPGVGFELIVEKDMIVLDADGGKHAITELALADLDSEGRVYVNVKFSDQTSAIVVSAAREPRPYSDWTPELDIPARPDQVADAGSGANGNRDVDAGRRASESDGDAPDAGQRTNGQSAAAGSRSASAGRGGKGGASSASSGRASMPQPDGGAVDRDEPADDSKGCSVAGLGERHRSGLFEMMCALGSAVLWRRRSWLRS
jgi:hypothetical protein